jgi:hypothetical protein
MASGSRILLGGLGSSTEALMAEKVCLGARPTISVLGYIVQLLEGRSALATGGVFGNVLTLDPVAHSRTKRSLQPKT